MAAWEPPSLEDVVMQSWVWYWGQELHVVEQLPHMPVCLVAGVTENKHTTGDLGQGSYKVLTLQKRLFNEGEVQTDTQRF